MPEVLNTKDIITEIHFLREGEYKEEDRFRGASGLGEGSFVTVLSGSKEVWNVVRTESVYDRVKRVLYHRVYLVPVKEKK